MKTRRHAKILELINAYTIDTQEELLRRLREDGFDVTQATVSRDIKELRLIKTLTGNTNTPQDGTIQGIIPRNFIPFCPIPRYRLTVPEIWLLLNV